MDRTLKTAKRRNKRRSNRNYGAWQRFSPDGKMCLYCPHDNTKHLCSSGQPHFYRKATEVEAEGPSALVKRVIVARDAELITAFCTACAPRNAA